jgi:hypothetical protein
VATPGQLVTEIARLLGVPENAVVTPWRALRDEGVVTKGPRGPHAAPTTSTDAANALIAVTGELPLKSVIESWRGYARLPARMAWTGRPNGMPKKPKDSGRWELGQLPFPTVMALKARHTLPEAIAAFIDDAAHDPARKLLETTPACDRLHSPRSLRSSGPGRAEYRLWIDFVGPHPYATITLQSLKRYYKLDYEYRPEKFTEEWVAADRRAYPGGDLYLRRGFSEQTILALGRFLLVETGASTQRRRRIPEGVS